MAAYHIVQASLNARFTYRAELKDRWRIMTGTGPVQGDCEDYALTLIWLWEGRSMWRFWWALCIRRYVLWHCTVPSGAGHVVLWRRGRGWTDNIQRHLVTPLPGAYRRRFPYPVLVIAMKRALARVRRSSQ